MFLCPWRNRGSPVEIAVKNNPWSGGSTCLLTKLNLLLVYLQFIHPLTCFFVLIYLTVCLFFIHLFALVVVTLVVRSLTSLNITYPLTTTKLCTAVIVFCCLFNILLKAVLWSMPHALIFFQILFLKASRRKKYCFLKTVW